MAFELGGAHGPFIAQEYVAALFVYVERECVAVSFHGAKQFAVAAQAEADEIGDAGAKIDGNSQRKIECSQW